MTFDGIDNGVAIEIVQELFGKVIDGPAKVKELKIGGWAVPAA
jgi:hypothetical protein